METVRVNLGPRSYEVRVACGLLAELGRFAACSMGILPMSCRSMGVSPMSCCSNSDTGETPVEHMGGTPMLRVRVAAVIADSTVARLYAKAAIASLTKAGFYARLIRFPAGEPNKTLATYGRLLDRLLAIRPAIDRSSLIVALGGGVVGDMAGFVAATALRGLNFIQCPTTLLADVDASVGGKTGVNLRAGKNLVGVFHQPRGVLIDVDTLKTLPRRQLANGLAECVKHAIIRDERLLAFIESNAVAILACKPSVMENLIAWNVRIKAAVVSADERESGERAHLNFGHTVGHAIETLVGYDKIGHGEAVSLGMVAACELAVARGLLRPADRDRVTAILSRLGLPVRLADLAPSARRVTLSAAKLWRVMQHDKKALAGKVRMVLPTKLGSVAIFDDVTKDDIVAWTKSPGMARDL